MSRKVNDSKIIGFSFGTAGGHGDRLFKLALFGLCLTGVLMVFSSTFAKAFEAHRDPYFYLKQHSLRLGIGFVLFMIISRFDYHHLRRWSIIPLLLAIIALILVLFSGDSVNRWISIFGVRLQPSEFARIALIVYLADWCARRSDFLRESYKAFLFAISVIALVAGLVVIEPSYSAASLIIMSAGVVLFLAGARWHHIASVMLPAIPVGIYLAVVKSYRLDRIISFLNPTSDPLGAGYQSIQSKIAVGSGKMFGTGFGMSGQKSHFLPEAHCDFIFSILCEERGFIGAILVVSLFVLFLWRGIRIALNAPDQYGFLLASGLTLTISILAFINIAVTLGLLPVTGLPLPFISYGGSAIIANMIACGIILNISRQIPVKRGRK